MKSLRKYRTYQGESAPSENSAEPTPVAVEENVDMEERIRAYAGMSDDLRWQLLVQKVGEAKRNGTMSDADLDAFAVSCRAMLDPEQYARLLQLIAAIKG